MFMNMPPFFVDLLKTYYPGREMSLLEIGCGNGHALLGLQRMLPRGKVIGINKGGYGYAQVEDSKTLLKVARKHKVEILCDDTTRTPLLPRVIPTAGLQEEPLPFKDEAFDIVISHHALNEGKLSTQDPKYILPRVMRLLKPGAYSVLLLLYEGAKFVFPDLDVQTFNIIRSFHVARPNNGGLPKQFTIMIYVVSNSIGLIIKHVDNPRPYVGPEYGLWPTHQPQFNRSESLSWLNPKTIEKFEVSKTCD
jgi:SAM-dependent methyltransferase